MHAYNPRGSDDLLEQNPPINKDRFILRTKPRQLPGSPGFFSTVLSKSGVRLKDKYSNVKKAVLSVSILLFIVGGSLTFFGLKSLHVSGLGDSGLMSLVSNSTGSVSSNVGRTDVSTTKITASSFSSYMVAPSLPRYLKIPTLNVDARVLAVGVNQLGEVGTPEDIYDTAWYNKSAEPGAPGAMLIDGHVSGWSVKGVFYNLKNLTPGDTIQVERGDGAVLNYKVIRSQVYAYNKVDMNAALSPVIDGKPGLNLITCDGNVIRGTNEYSQRIIVFSEQV